IVFDAAAISAGKIQIVGLVSGLLEQQQRSAHIKLDVVRVRSNCDGNSVRHRFGGHQYNPSNGVIWLHQMRGSEISTRAAAHCPGGPNFTGRPIAADRSAANMTSCVLAASLRLVNGISRPASSAWKKAVNWF